MPVTSTGFWCTWQIPIWNARYSTSALKEAVTAMIGHACCVLTFPILDFLETEAAHDISVALIHSATRNPSIPGIWISVSTISYLFVQHVDLYFSWKSWTACWPLLATVELILKPSKSPYKAIRFMLSSSTISTLSLHLSVHLSEYFLLVLPILIDFCNCSKVTFWFRKGTDLNFVRLSSKSFSTMI